MTEDQIIDQAEELHDDENEIMDEAHDPKNAEKQAVDAVKKAENAGKSAKEPGGKASAAEPMPKTKAGMINAMFSKMSGMSKAEMSKMYASYMGDKEQKESLEPEMNDVDVNFDGELDALIESEATLSDEFKAKTAVIFEAAVKTKLSEEINRLEEQYTTELNEEIETQKAEMVEKVDSYLNYVVENWMEENRIAIQAGLRTEIAENFMNSLKDLFTESYVEVPESKVDLVDEQAENIAELEERLNSTTADAITLAEELEVYKRNTIIREAARGLAETQVEKLHKLAEDIDFEDEATFTTKVATIKETYFGDKKIVTETTVDEEDDTDQTVETSSAMGQYLEAIRKSAI